MSARPQRRAQPRRPARRAAQFPDVALQTYLHGMLDVTRAVARTIERHVAPRLSHWHLETAQHNRPGSLERLDAADATRLRVAVVGGPGTGKTTLARALADRLALPLRHSDDLIGLGWSEASAHLAVELGNTAGGILEGVAVARALRKRLEASRAKPIDALVRLRVPQRELSPAQLAMTRGHEAILDAIVPELVRRGVIVIDEPGTLRELERLDARRLITRLTVPADTLADMRARFARAESELRVDILPTLRRTAERAAAHARTVLEQQVADALGVTHYSLPPSAARHDADDKIAAINPFDPKQKSGIGRELDEFVRSNVLRVRAMTHKMYAQSQETVRQGLEQGLRPDALAAKLLREVRHLAPQEAVAIANHAVGTFHAKSTELRQKALGITQYKWLTAGDVKVRPGHRALEGSVQSWDSPPVVDPQTGKRAHPGFDTHFYACRCQAIPVIDAATVTPPAGSPFARPDEPPPRQPDLPGIKPPLGIGRVRTGVPQPRLTPEAIIGPERRRPVGPAPQPIVSLIVRVPRPPTPTAALPPALEAPTRKRAVEALRAATARLPSTGIAEGADLNRAARTLLELGGLRPGAEGLDTQVQIERVIGKTEGIRAARNQRTGRLRLRSDVAGALRTGLEALDDGETPTRDQLDAVAAVLREHAFGTGRARAFATVPDTGAWLAENVAAEVNARRITRELAGLEVGQLAEKHPLALPAQSRFGAYQAAGRYADSVIAPTMHALAEATGWSRAEVVNAIEVAAQRYKALGGSPYTTGAEALRAFVSAIPDLTDQQRLELAQRLDDPRKLTSEWLLATPKKPTP